MTRAVLPNTSAREQWLVAGLVDRTTNHCARGPPLDGSEADDADAPYLVSDLEERFEDHHVAIACSLGVEHTACMQQSVQEGSANVLTSGQQSPRNTALAHPQTKQSRIALSLCSSWTWRRAGLAP